MRVRGTEAKSGFPSELFSTPPLCGHFRYCRSWWRATARSIFYVELWGIYSKSDFNIWSQDFNVQNIAAHSCQTVSIINTTNELLPATVDVLFNNNSHKHEMDQRSHWGAPRWDLKMKMKKSYQHCVLSGDNRRERNKVWFCDTRVDLQSDLQPSLKCYCSLHCLYSDDPSSHHDGQTWMTSPGLLLQVFATGGRSLKPCKGNAGGTFYFHNLLCKTVPINSLWFKDAVKDAIRGVWLLISGVLSGFFLQSPNIRSNDQMIHRRHHPCLWQYGGDDEQAKKVFSAFFGCVFTSCDVVPDSQTTTWQIIHF